jgi:flagellar biosynthetic protein FlhB
MSESTGEKSFAPTEKRKKDALKRGDVLRSKELATLASVTLGAIWLRLAGPWVLDALGRGMRLGLSWNRADLDRFEPGRLLIDLLIVAGPPVLLLGGGIALVTLALDIGLGGGGFIGGNLAPKASRVDPMSGLARVFGPNGWIELGKSMVKAGLLGGIAYGWARSNLLALAGLGNASLAGQLAFGWKALTGLLFALAGGLLVIALADFPIQWLRRNKRLRMTLQEIRDEQKETDGSPENKAAVRRRQRQVAMSGIASAMRQAQFVVTNPSHFSVALSWDAEKAAAPVVVAKGRGEKALAMREMAAELELPVLEYPVLARSLYFTAREKQMIREELYVAVAAVLAFLMSLKRGEARDAPLVDVPVTLRFDTEGRLNPSLTT